MRDFALLHDADPDRKRIPATLAQPGAPAFWLAVVLTGLGAGIATAALTRLLELVQHLMWPAPGDLIDAAAQAGPWGHVLTLLGAGLVTGLGQLRAAVNLRRASDGRAGRGPRRVPRAFAKVSPVGARYLRISPRCSASAGRMRIRDTRQEARRMSRARRRVQA